LKILCLYGSPRKNGNSAAIAKRFCVTAEELGAKIQSFHLNDLVYKGCQGCMACKKKLDRCVLNDDLSPVLDAVHHSDIIVLSSPIYYGNVTSQLKGFIDRTYSFLVPDYGTNPIRSRISPGKKLLFILVQGFEEEWLHSTVFSEYDSILKWCGFPENYLIRVCGLGKPGEAETRDDAMQLAVNMARRLVLPK
jgi:multimeric flavodoxin WrbA